MVDRKNNTNTRVSELMLQLEQGTKEVFTSERYREYLDVMSRFHAYSVNNCILIAMQRPDADYVAGFVDWNRKFGRIVKKGEKAIKIIAPCPIKKEMNHKENDEVESSKNTADEVVVRFRPAYVFAKDQTEGKELPEIVHNLTGSVKEAKAIQQALTSISPVPMEYGNIESGANGYYSPAQKKIVIQAGLSDEQTIKTMIHEIAHAVLHDYENGALKDEMPDRRTKEVQAESTAYVVTRWLGIDSSEYSFGYIAGWSEGRELKELKQSLEVIHTEASALIDSISRELKITMPFVKMELSDAVDEQMTKALAM